MWSHQQIHTDVHFRKHYRLLRISVIGLKTLQKFVYMKKIGREPVPTSGTGPQRGMFSNWTWGPAESENLK